MLADLLGQTSPWSFTAAASASVGYNDNLLLSFSNAERSAFTRGGLELLLWRVPRGRVDYFAFLNAEGTRYSSGESVHAESEAFAGIEWRYRRDDRWSVQVDAEGYYLDQVFDISDTNITRVVADLKVSGLKAGPTVHWNLRSWLWLEGAVKATRERYEDGLNDASIRESIARLGVKPGSRVELAIDASEVRRDFDSRTRYTIGGRPTTGELVVHERQLDGKATIEWGSGRHWKTVTRGGGLEYLDNGSGYLNYRQRHLGLDIDWSVGAWSMNLAGETRLKTYEVQTAGTGLAPLPALLKEEYVATARVERRFSRNWTWFGEYRWERTRSNDRINEYRLNEGLLGVRWNWEK